MESAAGLVVSVRNAIATVEVTSPVACSRCAAGRGCGAGLLAADRTTRIDVRIPRDMVLKRGDAVQLVVNSGQLLRAAMLAYGLPLAGLLLFAGLAALLSPNAGDLRLAVFGLSGLLAGVFVSRRRLGSSVSCERFVPIVERPEG